MSLGNLVFLGNTEIVKFLAHFTFLFIFNKNVAEIRSKIDIWLVLAGVAMLYVMRYRMWSRRFSFSTPVHYL